LRGRTNVARSTGTCRGRPPDRGVDRTATAGGISLCPTPALCAVLHDEDVAAAIVDRVLERGRFIHLDGPSGRTRHLNLEDSLLPKTQRVRISGIGSSEFPEPTIGPKIRLKPSGPIFQVDRPIGFC